MGFVPNTGIPNIIPNPGQDVGSFGLQKAREALNFQRTMPAPTDEQLKRKQAPLIRESKGTPGSGRKSEIPEEFDTRVDVNKSVTVENNGYLEQHELGESSTSMTETESGKEYSLPTDRIDRDLMIIEPISGRVARLPFVPKELKVNPESHFKAIASMGRNTPFYHFTGAEDTLEFEIDWFAQEDSRYDVIRNCKLIESWTKNDAYDNPPPTVILHWNKELFADSLWLITAAPYRLMDFQAHRNMLPQQAYQSITMKRVTATNLTRKQIQTITI